MANRRNGLKGGVKTPEGKAISRLNAYKHGIFTSGLTPEDAKALRHIEQEIAADLRPVGRVEEMLVENLALTYLRLQRCARAEAEYHIETWRAPNIVREPCDWDRLQNQLACGARPVLFRDQVFARMVELIDLYNTRLTSQFLRILHAIERLQRLRAGERVPPPIVAELAIHAESEMGRAAEAALQGASMPAQEVPASDPALPEPKRESQHTAVQ